MNCREWEERIAGDPEDPAAVAHAADCAGCQVFASGLRQSLEWLREAHADPVPAAAYAAVRARVMAEVRPRRRWGWAWAGMAAMAMAAVVTVGIGVKSRMRVVEMPVVALRGPGAPEVSEVRPLAIAGKRRIRTESPVRDNRQRREELVVKIETGDPDVVIYWITETKGDD